MTWTLHHGDCIEWMRSLPDKSVDHVIADPPYEAETHGSRLVAMTGKPVTKKISFPPISEELRGEFSRQAVRVARSWVIAFCQVEAAKAWETALISAGGHRRGTLVWHKTNPGPQVSADRPRQACELAVMAWCGSGKSRWNGGGRQGFYEFPTDRPSWKNGRYHETAKPLDLMLALVADFTDPGETILDPFCGSGTTGLAALRLGRRFAGCELDGKHYQTSLERLRAEEQCTTLASVRSGQEALFR
jgi:site-specific DNA-methyltransferase (adenine-specific)